MKERKRNEKKVFSVTEMRGVMLSSSKSDKKHASYMKNLIPLSGANHKRKGWEEIAQICSPGGEELRINGIHEYKKADGVSEFIVHAGDKMFRCSKDFSSVSSLDVSKLSLTSTKSTSFSAGGKLFITGCGNFLVYDGKTLFSMYSSSLAYVPITAGNIKALPSLSDTYGEDMNMLTPRRRNLMCGESFAEDCEDGYYSIYATDGAIDPDKPISLTAKTDIGKTPYTVTERQINTLTGGSVSHIDNYASQLINLFGVTSSEKVTFESGATEISVVFSKGIRIESVEFFTEAGGTLPGVSLYYKKKSSFAALEALNLSSSATSATFDGTAGALADSMIIHTGNASCSLTGIIIKYKDIFSGIAVISCNADTVWDNALLECSAKSLTGQDLDFYGDDKKAFPLLMHIRTGNDASFGRIGLKFETPAPEGTGENITFEYEALGQNYTDVLGGCTLGAQFSGADGASELILSGNVERKNEAYFSENSEKSGNYGYFPAKNKIVFGTDSAPVTALLRLSDSSMGVFKRNGFYRVELGVGATNGKGDVYEYQSADNCGCVNSHVAVNVNSDSLVLAGNGVCGVDFCGSLSSVSRCMKIRSSAINEALLGNGVSGLENAIACECDGRYYLFVNDEKGTVYVGDTRYKNYDGIRLDSSFEYEWWVLENCYASALCVSDGKIYMGREDGRICVFGDTYADKTYKKAKMNDFTYDFESGILTLNSSFGAKEGDAVILGYHLIEISPLAVSYDKEKGEIGLGEEEFFTISKDGEKTVNIFEGDKVKISFTQNGSEVISKESYEIIDTDTQKCTFIISGSALPDSVTGVYLERQKGTYELKSDGEDFVLTENGRDVLLKSSALPLEIKKEILQNVVAEYVTFPFDLGTHVKTKNLYAISVSSSLGGEKMKFGYVTRKGDAVTNGPQNDGFDLGSVDFRSFSFLRKFETSRTVRLFERNFNYIKFVFFSDENDDMSPLSVSAIYTVNDKITIGVS